MNAYFIVGTDTAVGKTTLGAAILAAARRRGLRPAAFKPAETGCPTDPETGHLRPRDATLLSAAAGLGAPLPETCPYAFSIPAAPAVAAREAGAAISLDTIAKGLRSLGRDNPDILLAEGAGGLLVPFRDDTTTADLIRHLDLPVLIAARAGLGTINHTLLTLECAHYRGLDVRGILFSAAQADPSDPTPRSNTAEIAARTDVQTLGTLPYLPNASLSALAEAAEENLALSAILPAPTPG